VTCPLGCVVTVLVTMNGTVLLSNVDADLFFGGWEVSMWGSCRGRSRCGFPFSGKVVYHLAFWLRYCFVLFDE
jgi:hypothetical protein